MTVAVIASFTRKDKSLTELVQVNGVWGVRFTEGPGTQRVLELPEDQAHARYKSQRDYAKMTRQLKAETVAA